MNALNGAPKMMTDLVLYILLLFYQVIKKIEADQTTCTNDLHDFMLSKFPSNIKFDVASVDVQCTLWDTPSGSSGKDYVSLLNKCHWSYYFTLLQHSECWDILLEL